MAFYNEPFSQIESDFVHRNLNNFTDNYFRYCLIEQIWPVLVFLIEM